MSAHIDNDESRIVSAIMKAIAMKINAVLFHLLGWQCILLQRNVKILTRGTVVTSEAAAVRKSLGIVP